VLYVDPHPDVHFFIRHEAAFGYGSGYS